MKLHSQLTNDEIQELHANTIEMMGGLPERQVFNCECGKQFLSYESFRAHNSKEHNIGLPSTYEVYRKYVNNNHSTTPKTALTEAAGGMQNTEYKPGDLVVLLDGHECMESFVNQEKIFTFVTYSSDKNNAIIENKSGYENITATKTIAPYTENKVPEFNYKIPRGNYIAMDEGGAWWQYTKKPSNNKCPSEWVIDLGVIGWSADRETPPWHDWKD